MSITRVIVVLGRPASLRQHSTGWPIVLALPAIAAAAFVLTLALVGDRVIACLATLAAVVLWFPTHEGFEESRYCR
jgi:hypothetical protein